MKKWDVILANPPFNLGEKMLAKWFDLADTICTVQPSTWLLGKKKTKSICSHLDNGEFNADIESINGSEYFDAAIAGRITINHFIQQNNSTHHNSTYILFDGKKYDKCSEITLTSNDSLLTEFKNIVELLYLNDNLQNHIKSIPNVHVFGNAPVEYNPDDNWWIFRITRYSVVHDKHTNWCITCKKMLDVYKFKDIKTGVMIQPYAKEVEDGELSLIFINKKFLYAIKRYTNIFNNKFEIDYIDKDKIDSKLIDIGLKILNIKEYENSIYARIDLIKTNSLIY